MRYSRSRGKNTQPRGSEIGASSRPVPPSLPPLRAKIREYFAEPPSTSLSLVQIHEEHSSNDKLELPKDDTIPSLPATPITSERLAEFSPTLLSYNYPLTKPRRPRILPGRKGIRLAPPFCPLVEPGLSSGANTLLASSFSLDPLIIEGAGYQENIHPLPDIYSLVSQTPSPVNSKQFVVGNPRVEDQLINWREPGSLNQAIHGSTKPEVIKFDLSSPIKGNVHGIKIDNLVSSKYNIGCAGDTLASSHFLAYAKASQQPGQDPGAIQLKPRSAGPGTWLTIPGAFGHNTFITDMASAGDYLAVTTSGGGGLVWEIPVPINEQHFTPAIRLQILPNTPGLKMVKWHSSKILAFASSNQVYLLKLHEAEDIFCGLPVYLDKLKQVAKVFEVISPIACFGFDYKTNSVAVLSFGGSLCCFVIDGDYIVWKATIRGHGDPSSLDIYDWGMLIGWKHGTILQLFAPLSTNVISTLQFINSIDPAAVNKEGNFTHTSYDSRLRTLWVAHSARSSLLAVRIPVEADKSRLGSIQSDTHHVFQQIVEIPTPSPITRVSQMAPNTTDPKCPATVGMYVVSASGVDRISIPQGSLGSTCIVTNLTIGTLLQEQPEAEALNISCLGPWTATQALRDSQPEASTPHPVRVNRGRREKLSACAPLKKIIEFDVSAEGGSIKSNPTCISIAPLVQLTANSISNKPPALLTFDRSQVPGLVFTVNTFLAYGMPNGRIGLFFRHSGTHALLKLPAIYGGSASVIDLAIVGNYLACVTNSGGAVIWNVPNTYSGRKGPSLAPLLQVHPSGLRKVRWHGNSQLALLSDSEVCLFDMYRLERMFKGLFVPWENLMTLARRYSVPSFIANFTFDVRNSLLATISVDSVLSLWSVETQRITWQGKIPGSGDPSSIDVMDNGVIIGRNRGNTLQLLAPRSVEVLSTFQFVHALEPMIQTNGQMYAHLCYDHRLRTLWAVNSKRSSLIAIRVIVALDNPDADIGEVHGTFEKVADFPMPNPIDCLISLPDEVAQDPTLAAITTTPQETRVELLSIDRHIFEDSLRTLFPRSRSELKLGDFQGVSPSLEGDQLRELLDPPTTYHYFEPEIQSVSPPLRMVPRSSNHDISITRTIDTAHPKEMSTDEMFACLTRHGCLDLTQSMNSDAYSKRSIMTGGFGDIWKGELRDGMPVAIKVWRFRTLNEDVGKDIKRAMREIYNWSKLDHENVHKLLGVIIFDGRLGMVSKWMGKGNLQQYIRENNHVDRYPLCIQIAQGVKYLHDTNLVHGDLKAINILVSSDDQLKLTDFDHSIMSDCTLEFSQTTRMGGGTLRWMAPELALDSEATHQRNKRTDVYALGMTFLETITGAVPFYQQCPNDISIYLTLTQKKYPRRDPDCFGPNERADRMWGLLMQCWDHTPTARPTALEVAVSLQTLVRDTEPGDNT